MAVKNTRALAVKESSGPDKDPCKNFATKLRVKAVARDDAAREKSQTFDQSMVRNTVSPVTKDGEMTRKLTVLP